MRPDTTRIFGTGREGNAAGALRTNGHALRPRRGHEIAENSAHDKPRHKCTVIRLQPIHHRRRADGVRAAAIPAPIIALNAD
jgi:hypothetical protein